MKEVHMVPCDEPKMEPWGFVTNFCLPGGGEISVYQPLHCFPSKEDDFMEGKVSNFVVMTTKSLYMTTDTLFSRKIVTRKARTLPVVPSAS